MIITTTMTMKWLKSNQLNVHLQMMMALYDDMMIYDQNNDYDYNNNDQLYVQNIPQWPPLHWCAWSVIKDTWNTKVEELTILFSSFIDQVLKI